MTKVEKIQRDIEKVETILKHIKMVDSLTQRLAKKLIHSMDDLSIAEKRLYNFQTSLETPFILL